MNSKLIFSLNHFFHRSPTKHNTGGLKKTCLLLMRWGCRLGDGKSYCECSKWQTHRQSSAWWCLPPPCRCVLAASSQMDCMTTFNSPIVLGFGGYLWYLCTTFPEHIQPRHFLLAHFPPFRHSVFTRCGTFPLFDVVRTSAHYDWFFVCALDSLTYLFANILMYKIIMHPQVELFTREWSTTYTIHYKTKTVSDHLRSREYI